MPRNLFDKARLADAGLADKLDHATLPGPGRRGRAEKHAHFVLAPDQRGAAVRSAAGTGRGAEHGRGNGLGLPLEHERLKRSKLVGCSRP